MRSHAALVGFLGTLCAWPRQTPAQAALPTPVVVSVAAAGSERVIAFLSAQFGADITVEAVASIGATPPAGPRVFLLWDEWTLARLAGAGALRSLQQEQVEVGAPPMDRAQPFVLPFAREYAVAVTVDVPRGAGPGRTWDELALDMAFHDRLGIVVPEVDGSPWLLAMRHRLERGEPSRAGIALWTTLDARAGRLASTYASMIEDLVGGRLAACVGPRDQLGVAVDRSAGRLRLEPLDGPQRVRFGIAVTADASPRAVDLARRLLESARIRDLAAAAGMVAVDAGPEALAAEVACAWWERFEHDVRGRGRSTERLAEWLDLVFGVLFLVCLWFVWRTLRNAEPEQA